MTEVGFYHLTRTPLSRALPKLLERVLERGHRALLLAGSAERVASLNEILWTYDAGSWLPHGSALDGEASAQPVFLTMAEENPNGADVLILVDAVSPAFSNQFARVIDMFDGHDDEAVRAARDRWRVGREAGFDLAYWQQRDEGGWERRQ